MLIQIKTEGAKIKEKKKGSSKLELRKSYRLIFFSFSFMFFVCPLFTLPSVYRRFLTWIYESSFPIRQRHRKFDPEFGF